MLNPEWTGTCHRCGSDSQVHTMSKFDTALLCLTCDDEERRHPKYREAVEAEAAALKKGDFHFQGIGWPEKPKPVRPLDP